MKHWSLFIENPFHAAQRLKSLLIYILHENRIEVLTELCLCVCRVIKVIVSTESNPQLTRQPDADTYE